MGRLPDMSNGGPGFPFARKTGGVWDKINEAADKAAKKAAGVISDIINETPTKKTRNHRKQKVK